MSSPTRNISCPVEDQNTYGEYANAFRVMQDGADVLLDFCIYSEQHNSAQVVSRVRVPPVFLQVILSRLQDAVEVSDPLTPGLYLLPETKGLQ